MVVLINKVNRVNQNDLIIGRHSTFETIKVNKNRINKIFLQKNLNNSFYYKILKIAKENKLIVEQVPKKKLDLMCENQNHQGIILVISPYKYVTLDNLFDNASYHNEFPFFLMLDDLNDPHNLGSIMRTADAVGVHGIIIPKRHSVSLTSTVSKISTGAIEHVPVTRVTNLTMTIRELKKRGLWIFGTKMNGEDYRKWNADIPLCLVIGNENKGVSPSIQKMVDCNITIPMIGHVQSLNASVASGILMYQVFRSRHPL